MCLHINGVLNKVVPCYNAHLVSKTNQFLSINSKATMKEIVAFLQKNSWVTSLDKYEVKGISCHVSQRKILSVFSFIPCLAVGGWHSVDDAIYWYHCKVIQPLQPNKCLFITTNTKHELSAKCLVSPGKRHLCKAELLLKFLNLILDIFSNLEIKMNIGWLYLHIHIYS